MSDIDPNKRHAVVKGASSAKQVAAYLPDNYKVVGEDDRFFDVDEIYIEGNDVAGWTLDGYVIPRLASGLLFAREMFIWAEEDGDPENGPHVSIWLEDEPQTTEAMARAQAESDAERTFIPHVDEDDEREERSYIYRGIE